MADSQAQSKELTIQSKTDIATISSYGKARSTVNDNPLSKEELEKINKYFRASLYLCLGMIYLKHNPLLKEPLSKDHIKPRILGHWGSDAGQIFTWIHSDKLIKELDLNMLFISGPGHGAPAVLSQAYLEGTYSEVYTEITEDEQGMQKFFKHFSFPGGIGSHATPETPGSLHEGGELGYSISHAFGVVYDNPDLIALTMVGDGESETGPLATSWHSNKFLNPITDGAVLPVLHLNGYKINNPTILARIPHEQLKALFIGYGWEPYFVEGDDHDTMHQAMASTLRTCITKIREYQKQARDSGKPFRPDWPMIVLRTPKGWTGPRKIDGHYLEGFWRSHQVPLPNVLKDDKDLKQLEEWMKSYGPEELFDKNGKLIPELKELAPTGNRRMSANPVSNGGQLRKPLDMPDFRKFALEVSKPGTNNASSMIVAAKLFSEVMRLNPHTFRAFGPDETQSNKLDAMYEVSKKTWLGEYFPEDSDGGNLSPFGRVMEMLSEHTVEGWLEGYLLSGRHGFLNSYEPFIHVIDSMVNQHIKWLEKCAEVEWRARLSSLNIILTATVWRQDHNGFTHQDPGFLDVLVNKSPEVVRIYLPPDANCMLSVTDHCLRSANYVNCIVADKQDHLQYLSMEEAVIHCTKGIGIWHWASNDSGVEPDVVMASCGDVATFEALAAVSLLRTYVKDIKIRFVNVVDLFRLIPKGDHPHGMSDTEYDAFFTYDKPVIFNFHSYPWLIHRLTYRRKGSRMLHVTGYREKGNINTPLELAIRNGTDRFSLAIDAIDRIPRLSTVSAEARDTLKNMQIQCRNHAYEFGIDDKELSEFTWKLFQ